MSPMSPSLIHGGGMWCSQMNFSGCVSVHSAHDGRYMNVVKRGVPSGIFCLMMFPHSRSMPGWCVEMPIIAAWFTRSIGKIT